MSAVERFLEFLRTEKRYSEHTVNAYGRDLNNMMRFLGTDEETFDPKMLSTEDLREWIAASVEGGLAPRSVNRMICSVRSFYKYLKRKGMAADDVILNLNFLRTPTRLPEYVREADMKRIIRTPSDCTSFDAAGADTGSHFVSVRNELILLLFYTTGMRLAELIKVRWSDFSTDFTQLKIEGKGSKERVVPVIEYTMNKISDYRDILRSENIWLSGDNFLFLTEKGKPLTRTSVYRIVKEHMELAGIQGKTSPHILRHTFATHLMNDGADIREIQQLLGHSSLAATQVYTHNSITQLKEIYDKAHPRRRKN